MMGHRPAARAGARGSVAICGASTARVRAGAAAESEGKRNVRPDDRLVSLLSMAAMLIYPPVAQLMKLDARRRRLPARRHHPRSGSRGRRGYSIDQATGDIATMTKLMRVALLAPALLLDRLVAEYPKRRAGAAAAVVPGLLRAVALANLAGSCRRASARWQRRCRASACDGAGRHRPDPAVAKPHALRLPAAARCCSRFGHPVRRGRRLRGTRRALTDPAPRRSPKSALSHSKFGLA